MPNSVHRTKKSKVILISLLILGAFFVPVVLGTKSNSKLILYENTPGFKVVKAGAKGVLRMSIDGYKLNAHGLRGNTTFTLIEIIEPWGEWIYNIGTGTTNSQGVLSIKGDHVPAPDSHIWLVLSDDFIEPGFIHWNPTEYLFPINYFH